MSSTDAFLWAGALFVVALAFVVGTLLRGQLYRYAPQQIMTGNELEFFKRLVRANPQGYVFPQVAMSALIAPTIKNHRARLTAFRRISQKRVDYAIYTDKLELICVVELDDRTHNARKDAERDSFLGSAGITTLRWQSTFKPSEPDIRRAFESLRPSDAFFSYGSSL